MKIVVASDFHLDHISQGVDRFDELNAAVTEVVRYVVDKKNHCDLFIFLGDLCDPDGGTRMFRSLELAMYAAVTMTTHDIPNIWIAGNHDVIEDGSGRTTLSPMRCFTGQLKKQTHLFETPGCMEINRVQLMVLPFTASSHAYNAEQEIAKANLRADAIILSHLNVPGIVPGEEATDMARGRSISLPPSKVLKGKTVLQGHIHQAQTFQYGDSKVHIPGSLARLTFGAETHTPGFMVFET